MNSGILVAAVLACLANMLVFIAALRHMEAVYAGLLGAAAFFLTFWTVGRATLGAPGKTE